MIIELHELTGSRLNIPSREDPSQQIATKLAKLRHFLSILDSSVRFSVEGYVAQQKAANEQSDAFRALVNEFGQLSSGLQEVLQNT